MKKKYALLLTLTLLVLGATKVSAALKYAGHAPADVQQASSYSEQMFYLYNVGSGQMLDKGGLWSMQPALGRGISMTFKKGSSNGTYALYTGFGKGRYLSFIDGNTGNNSEDYGQLYIDQGQDNVSAVNSFTFTQVTDSKYADSKVYKISITTKGSRYVKAGTYYVVAPNSTSSASSDVIDASSTEPTDEYGYWIIVTYQDLQTEFNKAAYGVAGASAVEATSFMKDYDFARGSSDVGNWKMADGNAMKNHDELVGSTDTYITPASAVTTANAWKYSTVNRPYYIGNGYGDIATLSKTTGGYSGDNGEVVSGLDAYAQRYYGAYWTGNIHGSKGALYQTLNTTALPLGKYQISCQGFSTDGSGKLFAQVVGSTEDYQEVNFIEPSTVPTTYVGASKLLNTGYQQSVTVTVGSANASIMFGVKVEDGAGEAWTCCDNFSITYLGRAQNIIVFDELQTDYEYINDQVTTEQTSTLYLDRKLKKDMWNSIVLPVDLSTDQVKEAFGASAMLSRLDHTNNGGRQIVFEPVSLNGSRTAIEKGIVYIIKPSVSYTTGKLKTSSLRDDISVTSYYEISLVNHNEKINSGQVTPTSVTPSDWDGGIKHCGTYVAIGKDYGSSEAAIPDKTYILSDGKWWYNTVPVNNVKGFRGWIATEQNGANTSFVINGVEENVTAIDGITADEPAVMNQVHGTYTLSGQKVSDAETTTGLKKGIYIVGGRKVVVK